MVAAVVETAGDEEARKRTANRAHKGGRQLAQSREESQKDFLDALAQRGNVYAACKIAKVGRRTVYEWREDDAAFRQAWEDALKVAVQVLENEAWRRAAKGTLKPIYQNGVKVGTVREYSDRLMEFLLRGAAPEKYRERQQVEHSGSAKLIVEYRKDWRNANKEGGDGADTD